MSDLVLYDLAAADKNVRFGPFCWLVKFALEHKGLDYKTVALGFLPKSDYPDPDYGKLPILKHGDQIINDSANIIKHLEEKFPANPFNANEAASAKTARLQTWLGEELFPAIAPLMFNRVANALPPEEKEYFSKSREERFGMPLDKLAQKPELPGKVEAAFENLVPELGDEDFFGGSAPDMSDYVAALVLMWQHSITSEKLYDLPKPVEKWFDRISTHYDGLKIQCANC